MKAICTYVNLLIILGLLLPFRVALSTSDKWDNDYVDVENMIHRLDATTEEKKIELTKQLTWAQIFALAGSQGFNICRNIQAYDVGIWAIAGVYYKVHKIILQKEENKLVKSTIANHELNSSEQNQLAIRSKQVVNLDEILNVQRSAIKLLNKQTNLLRNMKIMYITSGAFLAILITIILSVDPSSIAQKGILGLKEVKDLECKSAETIEKAIGKTGSDRLWTKMWDNFSGILSLSLQSISLIEKAFSELKKLPAEEQRKYIVEIEKDISNFKKIINFLAKINFQNLLVSNAFAQIDTNDPILDGSTIKTNSLKGFFDRAKDFVGRTLLNPYVRIGMYTSMSVLTGVTVNRNRNDIKTYEGKIDSFEKQIKELKASMGDSSLKNKAKDEDNNNQNPNKDVISEIGGCIKDGTNGEYEYDEKCACAKTKNCVNIKQHVPKNANKDVVKLFDNLNELYSGDSSWINDDKKADQLFDQANLALNSSLAQLNAAQTAIGEKPYDNKEMVNNLIKSTFPKKSQFVASSSKSSKAISSSGQGGIPDFNFNNGAAAPSKGGIHLQDHAPADMPLQDIHMAVEDSVFDVISLRYKKTALPYFLKEAGTNR